MKIKKGDYVRTKDGVIAKITDILEDLSIDCDRDVYDLDDINNLKMMEIPYCCKDEYIIKTSPNIIDLIEAGDYVNGSLVLAIYNDLCINEKVIEVERTWEEEYETIYNNEIKSIVTKEQFKSMEYKVVE